MQDWDETLDRSPGARVVRWPFRLLAAVIVLCGLFATLTTTYAALRYTDLKAALFALSMLPIAVLVGRLGSYVAWKGRVLRSPLWPFASGSVAFVWVLLSWAIISCIRR